MACLGRLGRAFTTLEPRLACVMGGQHDEWDEGSSWGKCQSVDITSRLRGRGQLP